MPNYWRYYLCCLYCAIAVLFLFVIMLIQVGSNQFQQFRFSKTNTFAFSLTYCCVMLIFLISFSLSIYLSFNLFVPNDILYMGKQPFENGYFESTLYAGILIFIKLVLFYFTHYWILFLIWRVTYSY